MIRLFIGTPGAGKSYAALKDVVEELVYGTRLVITNLPLLLGNLNAYLAKKHPEWKDDINQRVRLITEAETKEFYRFRGVVGDIGTVTKADSLSGRHLPYGDHRGNGVLYVIDEAHIPFDSREWAETGPELTYYNSQHRKLDDELIFITQFEKLIDVRVRGFVQDFCYFQNMGLEKFMTIFRKPAMFAMEVHRKPPTGNNAPPPNERRYYKMDFELAKCYDTSAGVGIKGRKLPERKVKKGLNLWWILLAGLIVAWLISRIPRLISAGAESILRPEVKEKKAGEKEKPMGAGFIKEMTGRNQDPPKVPPSELEGPRETKGKEGVGVLGYVTDGKRVTVYLDNGEAITEGDGVLQVVERGRVRMAGKWYTLRANKNAVAAPKKEKEVLTLPEKEPESAHVLEKDTVTNSGDSEAARSERPGENTFASKYRSNAADSGGVQNPRQKTLSGGSRARDRGGP